MYRDEAFVCKDECCEFEVSIECRFGVVWYLHICLKHRRSQFDSERRHLFGFVSSRRSVKPLAYNSEVDADRFDSGQTHFVFESLYWLSIGGLSKL